MCARRLENGCSIPIIYAVHHSALDTFKSAFNISRTASNCSEPVHPLRSVSEGDKQVVTNIFVFVCTLPDRSSTMRAAPAASLIVALLCTSVQAFATAARPLQTAANGGLPPAHAPRPDEQPRLLMILHPSSDRGE